MYYINIDDSNSKAAIIAVKTVETSGFSDYKSLNVPLRMSAVGATVSESSVISCGLRCLNSVQECNSFVYNASLSLCTPGKCVYTLLTYMVLLKD